MDKELIARVQQKLKIEGFYLGEVDGIRGRMTIAAVKAFQQAEKLPIQYPGTIGPITLKAMELDGGEDYRQAAKHTSASMPWLDLAIRKKGLHEGTDYSELSKFLKSDGKTLGDPRQLPWCGDFVETCIALSLPNEALPINPYLARNWLKFGRECEPTQGCVGVFWRGSKNGISGHVAFIVGKGPGVVYMLGGNQGNKISVAPKELKYLLGCRWPKTAPLNETRLAEMSGGKLSINEA